MNNRSWRKQITVLGTAAALLLSVTPAYGQAVTPSSEQLQAQRQQQEQDEKQAQQEQQGQQGQTEQERDHWRWGGGGHGHGRNHEQRQARKLEHMKEAAQYFGISTEGKTAKQLHDELKAARKANPAKWDKFIAAKKAEHLARLQETAKSMGIQTEGKSAKQLHDEIREACKNKTVKEKDGKSKPSAVPTPPADAKSRVLEGA